MSMSLRRVALAMLFSAIAGCSAVKNAKDADESNDSARGAAPEKKTVNSNTVKTNTAAVPTLTAAVPAVSRVSASAGLLVVNTNPPRAKVYLDGVYYGLSPLRLEMEPGLYAIGVKLEGYRMVNDNVSVNRSGNIELELNLEK